MYNWDIPTPPPNVLLWGAVLAVGWRVIVWLFDLRHRHKTREQSIVDEFWYRTIILPECWRPLIALMSKFVERIHTINLEGDAAQVSRDLQQIHLGFQQEKNLIIGRFVLLSAFNEEIYRSIKSILDNFEDDLAENFASIGFEKNSPNSSVEYFESLFWTKLTEICKVMMKLHPEKRLLIEP